MLSSDKLRGFCLVLFVLAAVAGAFAKVYLVSVGIADYPGTDQDLRLCAKDAQDVAALYKDNTKTECLVLTNTDATADNVVKAMKKLYAKASRNDIVVFYFSGHGYKGGFATYNSDLSYKAVRDAMAKSKSVNKVIIADACYAGRMRTNTPTSNSGINAARKANVMLFLASRSDETSIEDRDLSNGIFTDAVLRGMKGRADTNHDRKVTAKELFDYVHPDVVKATDAQQHPVMWGKFSDNMPVMIY